MEKYPRGTQGPFSIPLLIKAEILFREKHSLGQDWIGKDGLMWAGSQTHCSDALISQICLLMGRTPYHEQENARQHIRSAVITGIHQTTEWDTNGAG